jgi:hypothetical protein
MPIITQTKQNGDEVSATEYLALIQGINDTYDSLQTAIANLNIIQTKTNGLLPTQGSGFLVNVASGILKRVATDTLINYAGGSIAVGANATTKIFINASGVLSATTGVLPYEYYLIAEVVSGATTITSITDRRSLSFEIKQRDLRKVVHATKSGNQALNNTYAAITGWSTSFSTDGLNESSRFTTTTGVYLPPETAYHEIFCRVEIGSPSGFDLVNKLGLFINGVESRTLDKDFSSSSGSSVILQGMFYGDITANQPVTVRANLDSGTSTILGNNNTELIIWRR